MNAKRISRKKKAKPKPSSKKGSQVRSVAVHDDAERAAAEAAIRAVREARTRIREAHDPKSYMAAYAATFAAGDEIAKKAIEDIEAEEEEEPDVVVVAGVEWRAVLSSERTYQSLRGPMRFRRKPYRSKRNGPTRCFFEERRGVMEGGFMPDLGRAVVEAVSELPAESAARLIKRTTGYDVPTATMKRTTSAVGNTLRDEEEEFFNTKLRHRPIPRDANAIVISVDALSFNLRGEGYKQATAATISLLDAQGERIDVVKLGEMPESGKQTIMERVEREVLSITRRRPDLIKEVIIDGAPDLREHLQARFPDAVHVTDFFHVMEHIADALRYIIPHDEKMRNEQRRRLCHALKHDADGSNYVRTWLRDAVWIHGQRLSNFAKNAINGHATYLDKQLPFLCYSKAANDNLDLGSGAVEAACKTLVTQRLKISGAKWSRNGARAILYLRSLAQSGRLDDALDFHHARRLKRATLAQEAA
jgi:hypothetical protein